MHVPAALAVPAALLVLFAASGTGGLQAQGIASPASGPHLEVRAEALIARANAMHAGAGISTRLGRSASVAALGTVAFARQAGGVDTRFEIMGRFHIDPDRRARVAVYAAGGAAALRRDHSEWSGALVALIGAEVGRGRWVPFFEMGYGGGLRLVAGMRAR